MAIIQVIRQPLPKKNSLTWYNASGTPQTSTTANISTKNGIRIEFAVEPDYSSELRHFESIEYEYSTDSGTTYQPVGNGTGTPAANDTANNGQLSDRVTNKTATFDIDQYLPVYSLGTATLVRAKVTDSLDHAEFIDVLTYTISNFNRDAFTVANTEAFNTVIDGGLNRNNYTVEFTESFNTDIPN